MPKDKLSFLNPPVLAPTGSGTWIPAPISPPDRKIDLNESLTQTSADLTNVAKRKINEELANKISNILLHA